MHRRITGKLVIATHNPGKLAEMRELLATARRRADLRRRTRPWRARGDRRHVSAERRDQGDRGREGRTIFPPSPTIPASWSTRSTARRAFSRRAGPGRTRISPSRWRASSGCCRSAARPRRTSGAAHFVSALCVAWPDDHLEEVEARVDGTCVWPPRGTAGFGYDPTFLPDGHTRTFGEMTSIEKHGLPPLGLGLSHRARAFVKLAEICLD